MSTYCWFPPAVASLPRVGTFLKPDAELIARLRPDLVFIHSGPHPAASHLATLKIRTAVIATGSLAQVFTTIRQIGAAAGVPERSDRLIADLNGRLDRVKAAVAGEPPKKVLIIVGRRTGTLSDLVAVGATSYLSEIAAMAGGVNVLAGRLDAGVRAHLHGDGHQPGARRPHRHRRDGRAAGDVGSPAAGSPTISGGGRRW